MPLTCSPAHRARSSSVDALSQTNTIAYLGPPGTFSEEAAVAYGGAQEGVDYLPLKTIPAVVTAIESSAATVGILPIENMLEGSVSATLDLLIHETGLHITGETVIPIQQCFVARHGYRLEQIEVLYANTVSLAQCRRFVDRCLPNVEIIASLSNSSAPIDALNDPRPAGAISTLRAAELTGTNILARDIADNRSNVTRFIVLAQHDAAPTGDDKTSFCFGFKEDRAGVLVGVLQELAAANINMTKLESRPAKATLGQYIFLVDIEGHRSTPHIAQTLDRIIEKTGMFKIFGSYPRWRERPVFGTE